MNKKEHSAALAAAEAELARLQAIVPEPEEPLMVLRAERVPRGSRYYIILLSGAASDTVEGDANMDRLAYAAAAYYSSAEQAEAYTRAFRTLRLIRRQPGIVANYTTTLPYIYYIRVDAGVEISNITGCSSTACMFPCFESLEAAKSAIAAVGAEELVFTANFLAGNITLSDYAASTQPTAQTGE